MSKKPVFNLPSHAVVLENLRQSMHDETMKLVERAAHRLAHVTPEYPDKTDCYVQFFEGLSYIHGFWDLLDENEQCALLAIWTDGIEYLGAEA